MSNADESIIDSMEVISENQYITVSKSQYPLKSRKERVLALSDKRNNTAVPLEETQIVLDSIRENSIEAKLLKKSRKQIYIDILEKRRSSKEVADTVSEKIVSAESESNLKTRTQRITELSDKREAKILSENTNQDFTESNESMIDEKFSENFHSQFLKDKENNLAKKPYYQQEIVKNYHRDFLTNEEMMTSDQKFKKWRKSIYEMDFSDIPLMEYIVSQMKDLHETYGDDYPLGFIKLDKEQYRNLKIKCRSYILNPPEILTPYCCLVISLTMIQFAIREKKTDNFWTDFFHALNAEYNTITRDILCQALLCLCVNEGFYFDYLNGKRRYVETIKIHAVISEYTLTNVMGTIQSYYFEVMNEFYNETTIEDYVWRFIDIMKQSIESEKYNVPSAFKMACKVFKNVMFDCIANTLYNINAANYRLNRSKKTPAVFYSHYKNWTIICEIRRRNSSNNKNDMSVNRNIRRYAKTEFSLENDLKLWIHIPRIEIPEDMIHEEVTLKFYDDRSEIVELGKNLNLYGVFRFYTEETASVLPCLYKKLSYRITAGDRIIYDSSKILYRDFIVFDNYFREYHSKKIPEDDFFLLTTKSDEVLLKDCYSEMKRNGNIKIYVLSADDDSEVYVNASPIFKVFGDEYVNIRLHGGVNVNEMKVIVDGNVYHAWRVLPNIVLSFENREILDDYTFEISGIKNDKLSSVVNSEQSIDLGRLVGNRDILHILIKNKLEKIIWDYAVIVVPGYTSTFSKEFYYQEKYAELLDIASDNLDFSQNDFPIVCETLKDAYMYIDAVYIDAVQNSKNVKVQLNPPVISWRINDDLNSEKERYILGSELPNNASLKVKIPFAGYTVKAVNRKGIRSLPMKKGEVDISAFKTSSEDYTDIALFAWKTPVKLFEIIHQPCIRELYLNVFEQEQKLEITYKLFGKADVIITAFQYGQTEGTEIFRSDRSENCLIPLSLQPGRYRFTVELEESDEFGFETHRKVAENREIFVGDEFEIFCQSELELKINECLTDKVLPVNNFYLKNIQKLVDGYSYKGKAYFYTRNRYTGEYYQQEFTKANPVIIRILEVSDIQYKVLLTDSEYDGFIYHKIKQHLVYDEKGIKDKYTFDVPDVYFISKSQRSV